MAHLIASDRIEADRAALLALKDMADYAPVNQELAVPTLIQLDETLTQAQEATLRARKALAAARAAEANAARVFHEAIIGAKAGVVAQFGRNAQAVAAVGLTKQSDRKRPARRTREGA
jgi:hypothetical protein